MAVVLNDRTVTLQIIVTTGKYSDGSDKHATRTFSNINPELSNDDLLSIAQKIGNCQTYTVDGYYKIDKGILANETE